MNNLTVINQNNQLLVESREVAELIGKEHSHLMRDIRVYIEALNKSENPRLDSQVFFIESTYQGERRKEKCFLLTRKGCDMVANKMTGEKGILFTATYVIKFEDMENKLKNNLPTTYKEALIKLVEQVETNEKLQLENQELKPKAIFADAVSASQTSILVGELAKILKQNGINTGQKRFFEWLRENGYLIKRKGADYNMPTQKSMEQGLFEIKETTINHSDGHISISKTPKVTGKGQIYFINKLKPVSLMV
ncbi:phage regulatory protein/antirepressor Ant [Faecalimicrobium sp. JNUCC 81]